MSEITKDRATSPKNIRTKLFAVITVVLWAGMSVFLLGMLSRPAGGTPASNVRTSITEDFENMLMKKMSDIVEIDCGETTWASTKRT